MMTEHPKTVRRRLLSLLYERFCEVPTDMMQADDLLTAGGFTRDDMVVNAFYLADSGLIEMITSYRPNWFEAVRILPAGIDLVENPYVFDMRFPETLPEGEADSGSLGYLAERLVEQADFVGVDGDARQALLRDVRFLREEIARPRERWRTDVIETVLGWIERAADGDETALPALQAIREQVNGQLGRP